MTLAVIAMVSVCTAAIRPPKTEFRNLKVLPKDISSADLNRIMIDEFEDGLGVGCNFCHKEDPASHKPDYASDEKPEKQIARSMMRMTMRINRQFFKDKHPVIGSPMLVVSCATCHDGKPRPGQPE
jgi:hypothetical protein